MCVPGYEEVIRHALSRRAFFGSAAGVAACVAATAIDVGAARTHSRPQFRARCHDEY